MGKFDAAQAAEVMRTYLDTLRDCADEDIIVACDRLSKSDSPFVPSAGQVYSAAEKAAAKRIERQRANTLRLGHHTQEPPETRERIQAQFRELVAELMSGKKAIQPRAAEPRPLTERTVRERFLDRWERENGRMYPRRNELLRVLDEEKLKAAAE